MATVLILNHWKRKITSNENVYTRYINYEIGTDSFGMWCGKRSCDSCSANEVVEQRHGVIERCDRRESNGNLEFKEVKCE